MSVAAADSLQLFGRNWKVTLWNSAVPGFPKPPDPVVFDSKVNPLDIEFRVLRTLKPAPNRATITLWNINEEHRALILKRSRDTDPDSPNIPVNVKLEAGYGTASTVLFSGDLREIAGRRENTDWRIVMSMDDGGQAIREARFPTQGGMCFPKGTAVGTVLQQACSYMGIGLGNAAQFTQTAALIGASGTTLPFRMTLRGSVYPELKRVCATIGINCSIQNGVLQLLGKDQALGGQDSAVVLSADTGLVESPESAIDTTVSLGFAKEAKGQVAKTPSKILDKKTSVVKARALLIPGLVPGRRVHLDASGFTNHDYVITEVEYVGQSWANEWHAVMVLRVYTTEP